jgi:hypothetical protein
MSINIDLIRQVNNKERCSNKRQEMRFGCSDPAKGFNRLRCHVICETKFVKLCRASGVYRIGTELIN